MKTYIEQNSSATLNSNNSLLIQQTNIIRKGSSVMKQAKIDSFVARLHSRTQVDDSVFKDELNLFLSDQYKDIVNYMNNVFFANESALLVFMKSSVNQGSKQDDNVRKLFYEFISEYITQYADTLTEYIYGMFEIIHRFFIIQTAPRPKQFALLPLITIIDVYDTKVLLSQKVLNPDEFHNSLVNLLKCQKFIPSVKGNIWLLISTIQGKFTTLINTDRKRQVQQMCLYDIKAFINQNKNFSTIAAIQKSFGKSLQEVFLNQEEMLELYKIICVLIVPLSARYEVSINALQLLSKRTNIFHQFILDSGKKLFSDMCGLLNHNNREFTLELNDTLDEVTKQIVKGIQQNPLKYEPLYQVIISKSWSMLQQPASYEITGQQLAKEKYKYNIVTILKILGTISPLVKQYQTPEQLHKFFNLILNKCSKKLAKAFKVFEASPSSQQDVNPDEEESLGGRKRMHIKFVLYNQKELISFISALSQIIYNINSLTEYEQNELIKIILISIEEYPHFFDNYVGNLSKNLVQLFKVLQIKSCNPFYHVFKRIISCGFKIMLNSKKFNVSTDEQYYQMIKKTIRFWLDLINHENWSQNSLITFGNILFQFFQTMIQYLDISYKSNLQIQIEQNADLIDEENNVSEKNQMPNSDKEDIAKTFFLATQTMRISNLEEYQYMHSLVLVFEGILNNLSNFNYSPRILQFYKKVVERIRVFPKSVSLMKVIRALNSYLVKISYSDNRLKIMQKESNNEVNQQMLESSELQGSQLNDYCTLAKKLYCQTIDHYLQKHQQQCLYECLKMLTSFPVEVYLFDNNEILRTNLSYIIKKCFQLGQQIISIANSAIECLRRMFEFNQAASEKYLIDVIPKMEKFIWLSGQGEDDVEMKSSKKIYLFVGEMRITPETLAKKIMDFLGSIGGLVHLLVDTSSTNHIAWDYQDPLQIDVLMGTFKCTLNLSKLLNRVCFLALNGQLYIKRAACEFLHSIFTLAIGNAAEYKSSKQVTSNFLDKVFPTILEISSNSSHPSQQLIHTILIQSIRFFALTQQPNSPDISTILKHLLQLYNGTQDMSCLGSKCIAQLVRWHIKSDTRNKKELKNYPIIKVIMRNIWTLTSNKKAKDGLILLLVQLLREIHRQQDLMKLYAIQICSIIINIGRSNQPIEKQFNYLIQKVVLSLNRVIRKLIIEDKKQGDQFKKYSTIHKFLQQIYQTNFFSIYSQQRQISFILWKSIITKYSHILGYTCLDFLRNKADRSNFYLFSKITRPLDRFSQKDFFTKLQSKMIAFCDVWRKMLQFGINSAENLARFKDIEQIVIQSYVNLTVYLTLQFQLLPSDERCLNEDAQVIFIQAIKSFPYLLQRFKQSNKDTAEWLQERFYYLLMRKYNNNNSNLSTQRYFEFLLTIIIKPSRIVPNLDYDILQDHVYLRSQASIKNQLSLGHKKDIFQSQNNINSNNHDKMRFSQLMLDYMVQLKQQIIDNSQQSSDILSIFFSVIEKLFYCSQHNLIKFLFSPRDDVIQLEGFSASLIENVYNSRNSYIYQREVKTILSSLVIISKFYPINYPKIVKLIESMINILKGENGVANDKKKLIVSTVLGFQSYSIVKDYVVEMIAESGQFYVKHQKTFNTFLLNNFKLFCQQLFFLMNKQVKVIKLFYYLKTKLTVNSDDMSLLNRMWMERVPRQLVVNDKTENDCYRLNYFFVQTIPNIENQKEYLQYIVYLIKQGLNVKKISQIHFLTINLAAITLRRLKISLKPSLYQIHQVKATFDRVLTSVSNFYIPYTLGQIKKEDQIMNAERYLKAIQNMIYLLDDYKYCVHLFVGFKDSNLIGKLKRVHDSIIESIISKYYSSMQYQLQYEFAEWILSFYQNEELNNKHNPWNNFRLTIIERMFAKMIHFTQKRVLLQLFQKYTPMLLNIISGKVNTKNVEDMVMEFQIRQGAFVIIQNLYMYLPKPEKDKTIEQIHTNQYHKKIIPRIVEVLKSRFDNSGMILMSEYDKNSAGDRKSMDVFRNYMCAAYNCLIVIFISTQSKMQQFKRYLFDKGQVLWQHLVDPLKTNYDFPIQTDFQLMKPIQALSKFQFKNDNLQKKIRDEYMQSSLYIIDEQAFPQHDNAKLEQEDVGQQVKKDDIKEGSMEKVMKMEIEEDYINRHPCMINLLRVIDYMYKEFYDGNTPVWMRPIYDELMSDDLPLSVRILLTKVILNRPAIFTQATMWGQCLINYLSLGQNGGKYIHYYYRDVLLLLIKYIKNGYKPKTQDINAIIVKLIRCLPHDENMLIYSSNIDILEEFMKIVPDIYIDKSLIYKMLTVKPKNQDKKNKNDNTQFQWRMCTCIIMKSALIYKVPLVSEQEWKLGKTKNKAQKFYFFIQLVKQKVIKLIEQLLFDNKKKYRVAAAGLLGELLRFFNEKDSSYTIDEIDKNNFLHYIKALLTNIYAREQNRQTKERFSLVLFYLISRYPLILSDSKIFGMFDTVIIRYKKDERYKLLQAGLEYLNYLVNSEQKSFGYSVELMQSIRTSIDKFIADNLDVYKITIKIIKQYAKPFFLEHKQIFLAIHSIFDTLEKNYANSDQESICIDFYQFVFLLKDFLNEINEEALRMKPYINEEFLIVFKTKIKQCLIAGLGNKINSVRKIILEHFEQSFNHVQAFESRIIQLLKEIHSNKYQNLWLINSIPLIFSMAKKSSNYNTFLFNKQIEQSAQFYDVDFKNIAFHNSSQPYTPAYSFFTSKPERTLKMSEASQQGSFIGSLGSNRLGGMIRATQNSYMSQQQQVFTILGSQSSQDLSFNSEIPESQRMQIQNDSSLKQDAEEQRNYVNMNNIFMDVRKRKKFKEIKPQSNLPKFDAKVNVIGDKIRFKPKIKVGEVTSLFRFKSKNLQDKKVNQNNQKKIHSSYRSYKVGEMPNVQITVANILQPLVEICCFDKQLSSEFFTIFLNETISKIKDLEKTITQWFIDLLKSSYVYDFSFISTLQKCLIAISEQGHEMIKVSMNEIAIKSNTIDYAIVFTEQNLIKHRKSLYQKQKYNILIEDEGMEKFVKSQWSDLIDLYQKISGHAFLPPLLKHITKENQYHQLIKTLNYKQDGAIVDCYRQLEDLMKETQNSRLHDFLQREKIDCLALLGQWEPITDSLQTKLQRKTISTEEKKLLTISLLNSDHRQKEDILQNIRLPDEKLEYEKGLISLMGSHTDLADYYTGKQIESFYKFFKKTTSFDYNSKHALLQNIQKVYEMREFISIYRNKEPMTIDILNVMNKWAKRLPNQMFDSDLTWIQLLESRMLYTRMLNDKFSIPQEKVVKAKTDFMIQVVNQMLRKNIYGCAEVISRKALKQMKDMKVFNWGFYEALSNLKLFEYKKKVIINPANYELTPKVILKQLTSNNKTDYYSDIKYLSIENDHLEGFISSCIKALGFEPRPIIDPQQLLQKINKIYMNYERMKKSYKNLHKQNQLNSIEMEKINCKIHVNFSLFLQSIIELYKGRHQIKQIGDMMENSNLPLYRLTQNFVLELIQSISLMNFNAHKSADKKADDKKGKYRQNISIAYNHKEKEQNQHKVFEMILKLLKVVQSEKKKVGQIFAQAINDRKLPVWIFVYFIPQIIRTLNSHELVEYFADLFDSILNMYPQSLVYHFNCYFEKQVNCFTDSAKQVYYELHKKMDVNFKFIDALESLYHPEKRLKQILQGFYRHGEDQSSIQELQDFIDIENKRLGKYNKKFIQQHKPFIKKIINLRRQKKTENAGITQIQKLIKMLDPKSKQSIHQIRDYSKISDGSLFFEDYNSNDWNRIQVPATIYCKFQEPLSWNRVFIESFDLSVLTLKSQRKPKRITLYGSNEKKYMFLVKGGEDVRLDQRIQEMFNIMNKILKNNPECAKKKLQIKRFEVIPIKKMLGIFEWIDETQTLKEVLQKQLRKVHENYNLADMNPAVKEYTEKVRSSFRGNAKDNAQLYRQFLSLPEQQIVSNLRNCQNYMPFGLLRKTLLRLSKSYDFYLHIKNLFLSNYAVACIVGYVLGIGDRHLENFLIHGPSASVILIDFGYSFGASRDLAVPELIPFRLTKCFMEIMQPIGYEGIFKQAMKNSLMAFQDHKNVIIDFCDVFIDDPLMEWIWKCKRDNPSILVTSQHISMTISQEPPERKIYSKRIEYVKKKLNGEHPRKILMEELYESKHKQSKFIDEFKKAIWKGSRTEVERRKKVIEAGEIADELIRLASDKNILGRCYIGLNPFV